MAHDVSLYDWHSEESDDGHVDVHVVWLVVTDVTTDGPETIRLSATLPAAGDPYVIGTESTAYFYARRARKAKRVTSKPHDKRRWYVNQMFSTRPLTRFDATGPVSDPLLEEPDISGSALTFLRRFTVDSNGDPLVSSTGERYTGPEIEDDDNDLELIIVQNRATDEALLISGVMKTTPWNDAPLYGLPAESWKLNGFATQKVYQGDGTAFWKRTLRLKTGDFVRQVLDEGTMEFIGTDTANPKHYARIKDGRGENVKKLPLDGSGNVLTNLAAPVYNNFELKGSSNLLLLGLPATL